MKNEPAAVPVMFQKEVIDVLDSILTESDDRAYLVCSAYECAHNLKGRCSIHVVKGRRKILSNGRCAEYSM